MGATLGIARKNLEAWHTDMARSHELSTLQIRDLAPNLTTDTGTPLQTIAALRKAARSLTEVTADTPLAQVQQIFEHIALCRGLPQSTLSLLYEATRVYSAISTHAAPAPRVAILSSPLFYAAMQGFAPVLSTNEPLLCGSFSDIYERIAAGDAAFGILPLEDSAEGKLFRIYEELEQFDLHVAYTRDLACDGKTVRMALLYKTYPPTAKVVGTRTIECVLYEEEDSSLCRFLTVANALGLTLRRIDSLPVSYREDGFAKHVVLQACGEEPLLLTAYIALFMPRTVIVANYIHIDKELS